MGFTCLAKIDPKRLPGDGHGICLTLVWDWIKLCKNAGGLKVSVLEAQGRLKTILSDESLAERHIVNRLSLLNTNGSIQLAAEAFGKQAGIGAFASVGQQWMNWGSKGQFLANCLRTRKNGAYLTVIFRMGEVAHAIGVLVIKDKGFLVMEPNAGEFFVEWGDTVFWDALHADYCKEFINSTFGIFEV